MNYLKEEWDSYHYLYTGVEDLSARPVPPFGIDCAPGHCVVEMLPAREKYGSIVLPDELAHTMRSDAGWLLSAGDGVPLEPLSLVLVAYGHGLRVRDYRNDVYDSRKRAVAHLGDENAHGRVVFTGCAGGEMISDEYGDAFEPCSPVPWWESIVAVMQDVWVPTGHNVRVRLRPVKREGSLELVRRRYEPECEVLSVGKDAFTKDGKKYRDVKPGQVWVFDEGAVKRIVGTDEALVPDFGFHAQV